MATSLLPYNLIKAHKIDIKGLIRSQSMAGWKSWGIYPDWGIRGNRGMGIWAENALWYDGCSLWERLPRHG
jgi:hypothetical protein